MDVNELKFEDDTGYRSERKSNLNKDKMKKLLEEAYKRLNAKKQELKKAYTEYKKAEDGSKAKIELSEKIARLELPVSLGIVELEAFFGTSISNSDNFAWALNPKNPGNMAKGKSTFKNLVETKLVGKMRIGAHHGKTKNKARMSVNFRLEDG